MWKNLAGEHLTKFTSKCESNHHCKPKPSNQGEEEHPEIFRKKVLCIVNFIFPKKTLIKKVIFANNTK